MTTISTKLVKDGNSVAVRLPKPLLEMSGLHGAVKLEAKQGQIIIKQQKGPTRANWAAQIKKLVAKHGDPSVEFADLNATTDDGMEDLPWNGPTYEQWQKEQSKD